MEIAFGEELGRTDSGKHKFLTRLAKEFERQGHRVVTGKSDVFLHICRNTDKNRAKASVARVDGLILNSKQGHAKQNKKLVKAINGSDGVVYQGEFCRDSYEKFLGVKKRHACILNGASEDEFAERSPRNFFLANCKWRPHKRLGPMLKAFNLALEKGLDADLVVVGDTVNSMVDRSAKRKRVKMDGWANPAKLKKLLSTACATVHLAWLDWCPNAMVESIVSGCPVIYTDSGGCKQLGEGHGGIRIEDTQWNFQLVDLYRPPKIDIESVADAMIEVSQTNAKARKEDLLIENVAKKYIGFFEEVLG